MDILDELGMQEADIGSLARDLPDRPRPRERSADETLREFRGLLEEAKPPLDRSRRRREVTARAEQRATRLVEAVDGGESIGTAAERLGVSLPLADRAHSYAAANLELPADVRERLGRVHEGAESAAMVEALGGEEEVESLAEELADGMREAGL